MSRNFLNIGQSKGLSGFTFIELLTVMAIISLTVFLVSDTLQGRTDQERIDQTLRLMGEIEKAFLGRELPDEPLLRTAGYIPDLGTLPELINGQPRGLWTPDTDNDGEDDLLKRRQFMDDGHGLNFGFAPEASPIYIWMGWRGPYISAPRNGLFRDAWGNALIFWKNIPEMGDLTIISPGANGIASEKDRDADGDIRTVIRKTHFTAPVAGTIALSSINEYSAGEDVRIRIYYAAPAPGNNQGRIKHLTFMEPEEGTIREDGYFLFRDVPIGTDRLLEISQPLPPPAVDKTVITYLRFEVLPALNWLGKIEIRNAYEIWD